MGMRLTSHKAFLKQMLVKAQNEANTEQKIKLLKDEIRKIPIKSRIFDTDNIGLQIIPNLAAILSKLYEKLSVIQTMVSDPDYPTEFKIELKSMEQMVRFSIDVFDNVQRIQTQLMRFSPIFRYHSLNKYINQESLMKFRTHRQDFQDIMKHIFQKEMAYFTAILSDHDDGSAPDELIRKLVELKASCEKIYELLKQFFKQVREECPRYYFFTDEQMTMLCSLLKFPKSMFGLIANLFKDIQHIDILVHSDSSELEKVIIEGVEIKNGERIKFSSPRTIDLSSSASIPLTAIVQELESVIQEYFNHSRSDYLFNIAEKNFNFADIFTYTRSKAIVFQHVRLFVQMVFDYELFSLYRAAHDSGTTINVYECLVNLKAIVCKGYTVFFHHPTRFIGEKFADKPAVAFLDSFIMMIRHFECILDMLIKKDVYEFASFDYQVIPKYGVEINTAVLEDFKAQGIASLSAIEDKLLEHTNKAQHNLYRNEILTSSSSDIFKHLYCCKSSKVTLNTLSYSIEHKSELRGGLHPTVYFPMIESVAFTLVSSIVNNKFVMLTGSSGIGKNSYIRALSQLAGNVLYEFDCSLNNSVANVPAFFTGLVKGGYWVNFKGLEKSSNQLLSVLCTQVEMIKTIIEGIPLMMPDGTTVESSPGYCVFTTCRTESRLKTTQDGFFQSNPTHISLLEQFRVVNLHQPDLKCLISTLVSPAMTYTHSVLWTTRFLIFAKMLSQLDLGVDSHKDASHTIQRMHLKTVCSIIRGAMSKLYLYIESLYEQYREKGSTKTYRLNINQLEILAHNKRRGVFTRLFIEEITNYFYCAELSSTRVRSCHELLCDIFKEEIEPVASHDKSALMPTPEKRIRDRILDSIKEFKEANRELNLPNANKTFTRIEEFIYTLYNTRQELNTHFLVYGQPNTQKSTLIELLAYIYSNLLATNFKKYWITLEAIKEKYLFGTDTFEGILKEIFYQCHNLDLEDKSSQPKKINYLFQSTCELFNLWADPRDPKRFGASKDINRGLSWLIFDGNTGKNNRDTSQTVSNVVSMFNTLHSPNEINHYIGFSKDMRIFYELNTISMLEPRVITEVKMFYIEEPMVSLKERSEIWMHNLRKKDAFFGVVSERVLQLIESLAITFINKLELRSTSEKGSTWLLCSKNQLSMLNSFLEIFEIFLNEYRKYHSSHDYELLKNNAPLISSAKHDLAQANKNNTTMTRQAVYLNPQMKLAQEAQGFNLINARSRPVPVNAGNAVTQNYLTGIDTPNDIIDSETRRLEGIIVFSIIYALYGQVFESKRSMINKILGDIIHGYSKKTKISRSAFANNFVSITEQSRYNCITDYCFDVFKGAWIKWTDIKLRSHTDISSDYTLNEFSRVELDRIGCQNVKLLAQSDIPEGPATGQQFVHIAERNVVETAENSMLNYMLEHFFAYKKHILILSEHQQGKTLMINAILRRIIEQQKIVSFNFQFQRNTDPEIIQRHIEANLLKSTGNSRRPPANKTAVVWLDDLHMSVSNSKTESLLRCLQTQNGWFSYHAKSFFTIEQTIFLMTMSIRESETLAARESIKSLNVDIMTKSTMLKLRKINQDEFKSIFLDIVQGTLAPTPTGLNKNEDGLPPFIFKQLINVIYVNQDMIHDKMICRPVTFGLDYFYQIAKLFNQVSWKDVNKNKATLPFSTYFLLQDIVRSELGLSMIELKVLVNQKREMNDFIDLAMPSSNIQIPSTDKLEPKKIMLRGLDAGENARPGSALNFNKIKEIKPVEMPVLKRGRTGSMTLEGSEDDKEAKQMKKPSRFSPDVQSKLSKFGQQSSLSPFRSQINQGDSKDGSMLGGDSAASELEDESGKSLSDESSRNKSGSKSDSSSEKNGSFSVMPSLQVSQPAKMSRFFKAPNKVPSPPGSVSKQVSPKRADLAVPQTGPKRRNSNAMSTYSAARSVIRPLAVYDAEQKEESSESLSSSDESEEYKLLDPNHLNPANAKKMRELNKKKAMAEETPYMSKRSSGLSSNLSQSKNNIKIIYPSISSFSSSEEDVPQAASKFIVRESNPVQFFDSLLARMVTKLDKRVVYEQAKKEVHLKRRLIFDYAIQNYQDKDDREKKYEEVLPTFELLDQKKKTKIIRFMKQALETYIYNVPEAIAAFMLDRNNFSRFMEDFTSLHMIMKSDCRHMIISSIKAALYVKHLVHFICDTLGEVFYYFDLMLDDSLDKLPTDVSHDTYGMIKTCIKDNFDKIMKNDKRIVIVLNVGSIRHSDTKAVLSKVVDLMCSIAFNTDMILDHFCEQIHELVAQIKKVRDLNHYDDYFAGYIARNKLENKITFLIVHEKDHSEIYKNKTRQKTPDNTDDFLRYLSQHFPKFSSRAKHQVINGLRCGSNFEADSQYEPVLPNEPWIPSSIFNASVSLELAYLKSLDADMDHFVHLRSQHENVIMYNYLKHSLHKKFSGKHSLSDDDAVVQEQMLLLSKIQRRIDISTYDSKTLGEQVLLKELHIQQISANTSEMDSSYESTKDKKQHYFKLRTQLDKEMNAIRYEEENFKKICKDLQETQETILSINNKEFHASLTSGIFLSSHTFIMYSVLFQELFKKSSVAELTTSDLENLSVATASNSQYGIYSSSLIKLIDDMVALKDIVKDLKEEKMLIEPEPARLQTLYKAISHTENSFFNKFQADQQLFMLWIDLLIESLVLRRSRPEREANLIIILQDIKKLQAGIDECDRVIKGFDNLLIERNELKAKLEDDIKALGLNKAEKDSSIVTLKMFQEELTNVQKMYLRATSPFIAYNLDKDTVVEIIASFILFWNKYPYQVKRALFYNLIKSLNMDIELFNDLQIYDFISNEPPLISAVKSNIPFNLNMLNNASIVQLLQDSGMPFCVVRDPSGLFVKYLQHKYSRFMYTDYIVPSDRTMEDLELCIENGQPYLAVDPSEELLKILKPLIGWRFRRFCEHVLVSCDSPGSATYNTVFKGKNMIVKEGFRIIVILEKNKPELIDPALLAQCCYVNNNFAEKKIWNETLTEELIICLEEASRNEYIQGFMSSNLHGKIFDRYQQLTNMLATFDFMNSSVESISFKQIQRLLTEVEDLVMAQEEKIREKKENLFKAKLVSQSQKSSSDELDIVAAGFMSNHYAITVPGYFKLYSKYNNLSDKLRVYQAANDKFKAYVGDDLCINQELFMYMFKECIQAYNKELQELFNSTENDAEKTNKSIMDDSSNEIRPLQRREVTGEQLEGLFSKIEKTFFNQIINSIPYSCRYIYTFLCGLTHTVSHADSDKRGLMKKVHLMMFSEKIMPSQSKSIAFVSYNLYDSFNTLFKSLNVHFQYSTSNMPDNLGLMEEFDQKLLEVKGLDDLKTTFKINLLASDGQDKRRKDKSSVLAISALLTGEKSRQSNSIKTVSIVEKSSAHRSSNIDDKSKSEESEEEKIEDQLTRVLVRQETVKDINHTLLDDSKEEKVTKSIKLTHFQNQPPERKKLARLISVELFINSQGNFVAEDEYLRNKKTNTMQNNSTVRHPPTVKLLELGGHIEEKSSEDMSLIRGSGSRLGTFAQRSGELSPTRSKNSVKTLISATKSIIERNKQARLNYERRFVEGFVDYISKLISVITKVAKEKLASKSLQEWHQFMTFSKSGLLMDSGRSCQPRPPIDQEVIDELGSINTLTFYKYSRPDLMHYMLETFYAEIRGQSYFRHHLDLGLFAKIETFSKPIVLIYGQTHRSPYASLQRIADSMNIKLHLMRIDINCHLPTIDQNLESMSNQSVWVVLENMELMSRKSSFVLMRAMANFMNKQRKGSKFKLWALYHIPELSASHLIIHQNWPDWMSFCYRVHMDISKSIKEEMISLHWREIYQLSANTRGLLIADTTRSNAILMRSRSFLLPPTDNDLPQGDSDRTIKMSPDSAKNPSEISKVSGSLNLIQELTKKSASNNHISEYKKKFKAKLIYCLKFMWSVFRQRGKVLGYLLNSIMTDSPIKKSDAEIEQLFEGNITIT